MKVEQIYTKCLAQGSYYIENNGEAAVIDPLREVDHYLELAKKSGAKIKYIFETHFHADFVSGHVTLAEKTGATIVYGPNATPTFNALIAKDEQLFNVGNLTIKALHTPGHTMESTTYLLLNEQGKEHAIFSGDTLFLGDVGRPDLAQKAANITQEELAGILFDSLRSKIMPLPNDVIVYPGHGAGSACGKNMSKETVGVLGEQKLTNYALRENMTKQEFIDELIDGLAPPPAYFPLNVALNKSGYDSIDSIIEKGKRELTPSELEVIASETKAILLDVRSQQEFSEAHIPKSIFIGLDGQFAPWVGSVIKDVKTPIVLIAPQGRVEEAIIRLARVGFDNVLGYLKGGMDSWIQDGKETDQITSITAKELEELNKKQKISIVDVRKDGEFNADHIKEAKHASLDFINDSLPIFTEKQTHYVHCVGGYRSVIAISILKAQGIHNVIDVLGGFGAIKNTEIPIEATTCSSTLN